MNINRMRNLHEFNANVGMENPKGLFHERSSPLALSNVLVVLLNGVHFLFAPQISLTSCSRYTPKHVLNLPCTHVSCKC